MGLSKLRRTSLFEFYKSFTSYLSKIDKNLIKTIAITGAAGGLGRLLSIHFSNDGYNVIGIDKRAEETLDMDVKKAFVHYFCFDLNNIYQIEELVNEISHNYGQVDLLINNAGILNFKLLEDYTVDEINQMVTVNLTSAILLTKYFLPLMVKQGFGRIVNISSTSAFQAEDKFGVYSPTKSGMMLFGDSTAKLIVNKLSGNITSNSINPNRINTPEFLNENPDQNPKKLIPSEKVYKKILRIANSNVNGSTFPVFNYSLRIKYLFNFIHKLFWY